MSRYGYLEVFQSPLEFEITRVDCNIIYIRICFDCCIVILFILCDTNILIHYINKYVYGAVQLICHYLEYFAGLFCSYK